MLKFLKKYYDNTLSTNFVTNNQKYREFWIEKTLKKIASGQKILDAGAGELQYKKFCNHLNYTSQDFGQYNGKGNNEGLQTNSWDNSKLDIIADITDIPVNNDSFDAVMCIEVFEHLPEPAKAIKEFSRIIKLNGKLIITAPFCSITHFAPYYYANGYSKYWYKKILKENNFTIDEIDYNGNFFEYLAQEIDRIAYMETKYTDLNLSKKIYNKISIGIILKLLNDLSKKNKKSEEMLCFGLHILATKNIIKI